MPRAKKSKPYVFDVLEVRGAHDTDGREIGIVSLVGDVETVRRFAGDWLMRTAQFTVADVPLPPAPSAPTASSSPSSEPEPSTG